MAISGIDVSNYQGSFNWEPYRGKISFGAVLATEGTSFTDTDLKHDWAGMAGIGIHRLAYHYALPAQSSPQRQASYFIEVMKSAGYEDTDQFVLDLETSQGLMPAEVATWAQKFLQYVNSTGHRCLIYTNPSFASSGNCAGLESWDLWIADYGIPSPVVPRPWSTWTFWQSSGNSLDLDTYNGTQAELDAFMKKG